MAFVTLICYAKSMKKEAVDGDGELRRQLEGAFHSQTEIISCNKMADLVMPLILADRKKHELRARIDELRRIEPRGSDRPLIWTTGNDPKLAITPDERIAQLESELKALDSTGEE